MEHIKITRSEFFLYVKILTAIGFVHFLFNMSNAISKHLYGHTITIADGFDSLAIIGFAIGVLNLFASYIASIWLINRSEKRKGIQDKLWAVFALLFGPIVVGFYVVYGWCRYLQLLKPPKQSTPNLFEEFIQLIRRTD